MPSNDTTVRFKADISQLKSEMQAAQRQIKLVNSEFKAATAGMDDFTRSEAGLTAKVKQLNGVLDGQNKKLALMKQELEKTVAVYGESSAQADRVRIAINNQQAAINKTEKELSQYNQQLEELPKTMDDVGDAASKAADGFTVFKAALADLIADGIKTGINALKDFAQEAIQVGMQFESSMSNVAAISGASAEEMESLNNKAKEMGESTVFSATQAADAFGYMSMAGWKTEEMLDGIEGVMNLAAASGSDLATTADIVTDAITAMGYSAKDAERFADVMAATSANANTNVELMGSTLKYVAPIVGTLGMNMEDTAVAIGLMANAGIKGDKAGTALRSTLNRLSAPPKECAEEMEKLGISLTDQEGNMKSLNDVMLDLRGAFSDLSETEATAAAKHIAGQEAMSGLLAIVNATDKDFQKLTTSINNSSGAAKEMADTMNDNVGGQFTLLKSKIEGIMIKLFERASDSMKKGIKTVGEALDKVDWNKAGDAVGKFATKAADLFAFIISNSSTIISVLKTIGTLLASVFIANKITGAISAFSSLIAVVKGAESATALLTTGMGALGISMNALPIVALISGLALTFALVEKGKREIEDYAKANYGLSESEEALINQVNSTADALKSTADARKEEGEAIDSNFGKLEEMKKSYNDLIDDNGRVKDGCEDLAQELLGNLAEGLGTTIDKIKENIDANGKLSSSIDDIIEKKKLEAKAAAFEDDYNQAIKDEIETWKQLKGTKESLKEADDARIQAQKEYNAALEEWNNLDTHGSKAKENRELQQASANLEEATNKYDELKKAVDEAADSWSKSQATIENYNKATESLANGSIKDAQDALTALQGSLVNHTNASKEQLEKQVLDTKNSFEEISQYYEDGVASESVRDEYEQMYKYAKTQLDLFVSENKTAGSEASEGLKGSVSDGLAGLDSTLKTIGDASYNTLQDSMGNWGDIAEEKTGDYLGILEGKKSDFETAASENASAEITGLKSKQKEIESAADENANTYTKSIKDHQMDYHNVGMFAAQETAGGADEGSKNAEAPAGAFVQTYTEYIESKKGESETAGKDLASSAATGSDSAAGEAEQSGINFGQGFINGIGAMISAAWEKAKELARSALSGLKKGQEEGSPSKLTYKSGVFFGEGYENGIEATKKAVTQTAVALTKAALNAVKETQQEGSPSKLTYESGKNFTKGFITGIASLEGDLVKTTKQLVNVALSELLKLKDFNFADVAEKASSIYDSGFTKQLDYMLNRIEYANEQAIKDFDKTIETLRNNSDKAVSNLQRNSEAKQDALTAMSELRQQEIQKKIDKLQETSSSKRTAAQKKQLKKLQESLKKEKEYYSEASKAEKSALEEQIKNIQENYDKQIKKQQEMKEAYQKSSKAMISELTSAMNEYQQAAQKLINDTMNAISSKYQSQYDALINKQDNLIEKMKSAGDLFNLSGANVMTVNDLKEQTAQIKDYASKLESIKNKVSSELFDQIASYDMKEGNAFMDRLLSMSDAELKAYSDAYDEKMKVAESLSKKIYKNDFEKIAKNYSDEMQAAFKSLPEQLEALGKSTMEGFLKGLTGNTDYMSKSIKTFISGMIDTFKKQLGIASPSKVTMEIGELVGEGFAEGILKMVSTVQDAAKDITNAVSSNLDIKGTMSEIKGSISEASGAAGYTRSAGSFVGDRSQIVNFTQINNSPKALDRLTIYRQTNNILFDAKVGLSNV
jgi:TP901 family phage tail tape measure protein